MYNFSQHSDFEIFLGYGDFDTLLETESDLMEGLLQPKRTLFYNRSDGAGVPNYENHPNDLILNIGLKYDIAKWANYRNTQVGDGNDGTTDRRVAVSQNAIRITQAGQNLDIEVYYIPFIDYNQIRAVTTSIGIGVS